MKFKYQAKTKNGEAQVGYVDAPSRDTAVSVLSSHNLFILSIEEVEKNNWFNRLSSFFNKVRRKDMIAFTRQFSMLLEAQLPLKDVLRIIGKQLSNETLRVATEQISEDIDAGLSLSQAIERQGDVFSEFYVSMVRAAEVTGNLNEVAGFLADYTEREGILTSKFIGALTYPFILIVLFGGVVAVMLTVVFPQIGPVFAQGGVQLPIFTSLLINFGSFLQHWYIFVLGLLAVIVILALDYIQTTEGRALIDDAKVHLPGINKLYVPLILTRFSNTISFLLKGGVPIAQALEIISNTFDNAVYREIFHNIANSVRQGELLSQTIQQYPDYFPPLVSQMVVVGEATGQLDKIFMRLSNFYARQADTTLNNIADLLQPILLVVIGLLVALLFGSILLPLYQLTANFG